MSFFKKIGKRLKGEVVYRRKQWDKAASVYAVTGGAPQGAGEVPGMNIMSLMYGATQAAKQSVISQGTENFLATPTGKEVQQEATRQTVFMYLRNPIVIIAAVLGLLLLLRR